MEMDPNLLWALLAFLAWLLFSRTLRRQGHDLPPGPIQWPIVGSLLSVGFRYRHRSFATLAKKHGPLMHLRLGAADVLVVSSPELATEVLKTRDLDWSSRPPSAAGKYIGFDFHSLDFAPNGPHWRHLRKICVTHLFSPARIKLQANIRREEILRTVAQISEKHDEPLNLRSVCDSLVLGIVKRMLFGNKYNDPRHPMAKEMELFMDDVKEAMILIGAMIVSDLVPGLDWLDLQGYDRRIKRVSRRLERVYRLILDDHRKDLGNLDEESKDFVHVLLSLKGPEELTEKSLMGLLTDVFLFGIDITATGIEWAMAELIRDRRAMAKLRAEIDCAVNGRLVDEGDLPRIPFLELVVKEVLRLHPPVPLTDPHYNEEATELAGYKIPAKFVMFVNIWGLAHDPDLWDRPFEFWPERFAALPETTIGGNDFRFIPFSSGRRKCPAANLAYLKIQHAVAVLVQAFDWSLPAGQVDMNMEEGYGVICPMKYPLYAVATSRLGSFRTDASSGEL
uniref:Cytochrome P450 n=1 Tax=Araucaria cunninghamii TaxID=56994 RepID=A0A0D6QUM8_ARACU